MRENGEFRRHADQLGALYSPAFYDGQAPASQLAAAVVLPRVLELTAAASLVDVGCGVGTWVAAARELGVARVLGIDGPHVERTSLLVPQECFHAVDLSVPGATIGLERFDLAISLEVAEHLPRERASSFVAEVVQLAPAVLFSAAIPYQGGTGHINEQWPSWWAELFAGHGYRPVDLRREFWEASDIPNWYRQNMLLYVAASHPASVHAVEHVVDAVLPEHYLWHHEQPPPLYLRDLFRAFPAAVQTAVMKRVGARWPAADRTVTESRA